MKRIGAVVVMILALAACGHQGPKVGVVKDHRFIAAHDEFHPGIFIPGHETCFSSGKSTTCSFVPPIIVPAYTSHESDEWDVYLVNGKQHGWRRVNHATYDACEIGITCDTRVKR